MAGAAAGAPATPCFCTSSSSAATHSAASRLTDRCCARSMLLAALQTVLGRHHEPTAGGLTQTREPVRYGSCWTRHRLAGGVPGEGGLERGGLQGAQ